MTAVHITEAEAGTDEWHAARAGGIGGSEIAAVVGLSPFESRFGLWHRKAGLLGPVEENDPMRWGKLLEPIIAQEWLTRTRNAGHGWAFTPVTGVWRHRFRPWQIATPDRILVDGNTAPEPCSLLEVKLSMFGDGWGKDGTDEVPPHVRCQALWYLDVFGLDVAQVVVLIGAGMDLRSYTVEYDTDEADALRDAAFDFLDSIDAGLRPDIDDHAATYDAVRDLHPDVDGLEVELPNKVAHAFIRAKSAEAYVKNEVRAATATVADHMGTAGKATWDGQTIARRQAKNGGTPYVVAAKGVADMYAPDPDELTWADVEMVEEPF